jgi:hypothetical protein
MKNPKKPTVAQMKLIVKWKLDPTMWLVSKDTTTEMVLVHRHSDKTIRVIPKGVREDGR